MMTGLQNPFRPGAGHFPPYLAGRDTEHLEFEKLLKQDVLLQNLIITGLRGVGKTVLLESLKPLALNAGWAWVGTELSESASLTETQLAERMLIDLSAYTSSLVIAAKGQEKIGFITQAETIPVRLDFSGLRTLFNSIPGLASDKLRGTFEFVWNVAKVNRLRGIIFAYDEAQTVADHSKKEQYPLAMMLDVFQSIQRKGIKMMLLLVGLPTLFPKLVESRTFSERMFKILELRRLSKEDSTKAVMVPQEGIDERYRFSKKTVAVIVEKSSGYPYFIQFICREVFDLFIKFNQERRSLEVPINEILQKLDTEFFAGRWARATDRQRELLRIIATLPNCNEEFSVQEIAEKANRLKDQFKPFSPSHIIQILNVLAEKGLVYKNRHGKYVFAVPLLGDFIHRLDAFNTALD